jgi:hypothetical protein
MIFMKQTNTKHSKCICTIALLTFLITLFVFSINTYARVIGIEVEGEAIIYVPDYEPPAFIDGRVLVPVRLVAEALGITVEWDFSTQVVLLEMANLTAYIQIGSYEMIVGDNIVTLDMPAKLSNDRTMMAVEYISRALGMDVIWNSPAYVIHILEPLPPIEYWPDHLPQHVPGSITLRPMLQWSRHWTDPPMRFRHAFYEIPFDIINLVELDFEGEWWTVTSHYYHRQDINLLMRFVQYFDISREDFDDAMQRHKEFRIRLGLDLTDEWFELPNADIIYTFDNDIIRYFYRRE